MTTASVILCTFNRGDKLAASLESLSKQVMACDCTYEVLIVDNNSNDTTRDAAMHWVERMPERFRYVFEPCQGKSRALNRGVVEAQAPLLFILDDDCIAAPDWMQALIDEFARTPAPDVVGGRVELHNAADLPVTIRTYDDWRTFDSPDQLFSLIPGCNFGFRRELFELVGGFDPMLGPGSAFGLVADDTDFLYRALRAGARMAYSPIPRVFHDHGRRTPEQLRSLRRGYIRGRGALYCKHICSGDWTASKMVYWELVNCLREAIQSPRSCLVPAGVIGHLLAGAASLLLERCRRHQACSCAGGNSLASGRSGIGI